VLESLESPAESSSGKFAVKTRARKITIKNKKTKTKWNGMEWGLRRASEGLKTGARTGCKHTNNQSMNRHVTLAVLCLT
jgi:hypothetical protein